VRNLDKAIDIRKALATGSLKLSFGLFASTAILAIGTIILAGILSPEEYGLYSIALIPALMFSLFRDFGLDSALTKYVVHFRTSSKEETAREIIVAGLTFEMITGLALSVVSLCMANYIAITFFHRPESALLLSIISISIFSEGLWLCPSPALLGLREWD
jgi:O-antigen/teichoic acid export membrane protein